MYIFIALSRLLGLPPYIWPYSRVYDWPKILSVRCLCSDDPFQVDRRRRRTKLAEIGPHGYTQTSGWLYAVANVYAEGRPIVELLAGQMASPISSGVKITLSARLFGKRAYVFCEGTWQLATGNWQLGTGNCEPGKCHRHQLAIASATFMFFALSQLVDIFLEMSKRVEIA